MVELLSQPNPASFLLLFKYLSCFIICLCPLFLNLSQFCVRFIRGTPTNYSQVGGARVKGMDGGVVVASKPWSGGGGSRRRRGHTYTLLGHRRVGGRGRIYNVFNFKCVTKMQISAKCNQKETNIIPRERES